MTKRSKTKEKKLKNRNSINLLRKGNFTNYKKSKTFFQNIDMYSYISIYYN